MLTDRAGKSRAAAATQLTGSLWEHKCMSEQKQLGNAANTQYTSIQCAQPFGLG